MTYSARPLAANSRPDQPPAGDRRGVARAQGCSVRTFFLSESAHRELRCCITVSDPPLGASPGPHGVVVDDVKEGSSAEQMGLRRARRRRSGSGERPACSERGGFLRDQKGVEARSEAGIRGARSQEFRIKRPQFASGTMQDGIPDRQHLLVIPESFSDRAFVKRCRAGGTNHFSPTLPKNLVVYEVMASNSGPNSPQR